MDSGHVDTPGTAGTDQGMLDALDHRQLRPAEDRRRSRLKWMFIGGRPTPPAGYRGLYEQPILGEAEDVGRSARLAAAGARRAVRPS